jgi:hypothetical protein
LGPDRQEQNRERFTLIAELARLRNLLCQVARNCEQRALPHQATVLVQLIALERQLMKLNPE